jgi:hypothetical protein
MTSDPFGSSFVSAVVGRTNIADQRAGQPNPIIKSVLPNIPKTTTVIPNYEPEDPDWFTADKVD